MITDSVFAILGLGILLSIAFAFSNNRKEINWQLVFIGLVLQIGFALFVLKVPFGKTVFQGIGAVFVTIIDFTIEGSKFIFGPFATQDQFGFVFAFQVLPTIIFFSSLMSVLYHLGWMQKLVEMMAWVMAKAMRISGAESISVAANVFIGQTEAPLVVRPYVAGMTRSELLTLMVGGMATIAGGVLAAYVGLLGGGDEAQKAYYATHLLSASIMAAPATIVIAKILMPETETSETMNTVKIKVEKTASNVIDAAATGAADGLKLALNVAAMLLAFIALIAMLNWVVTGLLSDLLGLTIGGDPITVQMLLGYLLSPIALVIGVPFEDITTVGSLIGQKIILNEFVAYLELSNIVKAVTAGEAQMSQKAILISTYALCGFANFSSIAIQIGGIGGIAPSRRADLAKYGMRAVLGGSLATLMTATIAGVLG